ncbi:uncharacterized protein BDR25DRAFT_1524 [Lindgomyces ingoldianus]|uniref:Uncharacterized protein n=1 Tax=Lindgomyces ingoldianus TaxID=673940 RepID=A0ACB6RFG7_9PLEO|nr:uncharacterized protein BDR25DRAFT_1524 [Lindgomyces ingoldianus]KAF2477503.1 hypothetical protein BDR25DRAFT_1524 [Lindgomyces ingoldianus]
MPATPPPPGRQSRRRFSAVLGLDLLLAPPAPSAAAVLIQLIDYLRTVCSPPPPFVTRPHLRVSVPVCPEPVAAAWPASAFAARKSLVAIPACWGGSLLQAGQAINSLLHWCSRLWLLWWGRAAQASIDFIDHPGSLSIPKALLGRPNSRRPVLPTQLLLLPPTINRPWPASPSIYTPCPLPLSRTRHQRPSGVLINHHPAASTVHISISPPASPGSSREPLLYLRKPPASPSLRLSFTIVCPTARQSLTSLVCPQNLDVTALTSCERPTASRPFTYECPRAKLPRSSSLTLFSVSLLQSAIANA